VLGGAPLVFEGAMSKPELRRDAGGWREGVLERSSCIDISFLERTDPGVPALEEVSFVGDSDRARSGFIHKPSSTHLHHAAMTALSAVQGATDQLYGLAFPSVPVKSPPLAFLFFLHLPCRAGPQAL